MKIEFNIDQINEIVDLYLVPALKTKRIFTFSGLLGVGKTTLIKNFLNQCGVKENITSPTFNYVNRYENNIGDIFNHFDLYRIQSLNDFLSTGFDEFLYRTNEYSLIEWPGVIKELLETRDLKRVVFEISLEHVNGSENLRYLVIKEKRAKKYIFYKKG